MSTMHPHDYQHDHSREADDLVDEFKAIFQRARRGASDTLRAQRSIQARRDRAARARRAAQRSARGAADNDTDTRKTRVHVGDLTPDGGISEDLIARWAAAQALAEQLREEAETAKAEAAQSRDSSDAARSAKADTDAETAATWAQAWDERVRAAGFDPNTLADEKHNERDDVDPEQPEAQQDADLDPTHRAETAPDVDTGTDTDAEQFINRIAERAGEMAMEAADYLDDDANGTQPSVADLTAATDGPDTATRQSASPSLTAVPDLGAQPAAMADLDAGVSL